MSGAPKGRKVNIPPTAEITPEMVAAALDVLWEHRGTLDYDQFSSDQWETLVQELLGRALSVVPSTPNSAHR